MTPPYAKLLVRLDGGTPLSGGITSAAVGQSAQLVIENPSGVTQYLWEIYDYPPDFELPAGWQQDNEGTYYSTAVVPPPFELTHWGDYLFALFINNAKTQSRPAKFSDAHQTAIRILSPMGLHDLAYLEKQQFALRGWPVGQKANQRVLEAALVGLAEGIAQAQHVSFDDAVAQLGETFVQGALEALAARGLGPVLANSGNANGSAITNLLRAAFAPPTDTDSYEFASSSGGNGSFTSSFVGNRTPNGNITEGSGGRYTQVTGAFTREWYRDSGGTDDVWAVGMQSDDVSAAQGAIAFRRSSDPHRFTASDALTFDPATGLSTTLPVTVPAPTAGGHSVNRDWLDGQSNVLTVVTSSNTTVNQALYGDRDPARTHLILSITQSGTKDVTLPAGVAGQMVTIVKSLANSALRIITDGTTIDGQSGTLVVQPTRAEAASITLAWLSSGNQWSVVGQPRATGGLYSPGDVYTPTVADLNGITGVSNSATWSRAGRVVTLTGKIAFTYASGTTKSFTITKPAHLPSTHINASSVWGVSTWAASGDEIPGVTSSVSDGTRILFNKGDSFTLPTSGAGSVTFAVHYLLDA